MEYSTRKTQGELSIYSIQALEEEFDNSLFDRWIKEENHVLNLSVRNSFDQSLLSRSSFDSKGKITKRVYDTISLFISGKVNLTVGLVDQTNNLTDRRSLLCHIPLETSLKSVENIRSQIREVFLEIWHRRCMTVEVVLLESSIDPDHPFVNIDLGQRNMVLELIRALSAEILNVKPYVYSAIGSEYTNIYFLPGKNDKLLIHHVQK